MGFFLLASCSKSYALLVADLFEVVMAGYLALLRPVATSKEKWRCTKCTIPALELHLLAEFSSKNHKMAQGN
jgi:hypothetical protein